MMDLRQTHVYGAQHDYFDDPDVVGWTMEGDEAHGGNGLAVVLTNRTGDDKAMFVGKQHAGETWIDTLGNLKHEVSTATPCRELSRCSMAFRRSTTSKSPRLPSRWASRRSNNYGEW